MGNRHSNRHGVFCAVGDCSLSSDHAARQPRGTAWRSVNRGIAAGGGHLEVAVVELPGGGPEVLQQAALVGEGEVEAQVAAVLPEGHLAQEFVAAGRLAGLLALPLLHLHMVEASPSELQSGSRWEAVHAHKEPEILRGLGSWLSLCFTCTFFRTTKEVEKLGTVGELGQALSPKPYRF